MTDAHVHHAIPKSSLMDKKIAGIPAPVVIGVVLGLAWLAYKHYAGSSTTARGSGGTATANKTAGAGSQVKEVPPNGSITAQQNAWQRAFQALQEKANQLKSEANKVNKKERKEKEEKEWIEKWEKAHPKGIEKGKPVGTKVNGTRARIGT